MSYDNGTYSLFFVKQTNGLPEEQLVGRFLIQAGSFYILEDHSKLLQDNLPDGKMDVWHDKVLWYLAHSGYYRIVSNDEINEGYHEDMLEDLDLGDEQPESEYCLVDLNGGEPQRMEMYGDSAILNGHRLTDEELDGIMTQVRSGTLKLLPI